MTLNKLFQFPGLSRQGHVRYAISGNSFTSNFYISIGDRLDFPTIPWSRTHYLSLQSTTSNTKLPLICPHPDHPVVHGTLTVLPVPGTGHSPARCHTSLTPFLSSRHSRSFPQPIPMIPHSPGLLSPPPWGFSDHRSLSLLSQTLNGEHPLFLLLYCHMYYQAINRWQILWGKRAMS